MPCAPAAAARPSDGRYRRSTTCATTRLWASSTSSRATTTWRSSVCPADPFAAGTAGRPVKRGDAWRGSRGTRSEARVRLPERSVCRHRVVTAFTMAHSVTLRLSDGCARCPVGWSIFHRRLGSATWRSRTCFAGATSPLLADLPLWAGARLRLCVGAGAEVGLAAQRFVFLAALLQRGRRGRAAYRRVALAFPVLYLLASRGGEQKSGLRRELVLLTTLPGLCVAFARRFDLPLVPIVVAVAGVLPAVLIVLVPRYGYDRCVRIGVSALGCAVAAVVGRAR